MWVEEPLLSLSLNDLASSVWPGAVFIAICFRPEPVLKPGWRKKSLHGKMYVYVGVALWPGFLEKICLLLTEGCKGLALLIQMDGWGMTRLRIHE